VATLSRCQRGSAFCVTPVALAQWRRREVLTIMPLAHSPDAGPCRSSVSCSEAQAFKGSVRDLGRLRIDSGGDHRGRGERFLRWTLRTTVMWLRYFSARCHRCILVLPRLQVAWDVALWRSWPLVRSLRRFRSCHVAVSMRSGDAPPDQRAFLASVVRIKHDLPAYRFLCTPVVSSRQPRYPARCGLGRFLFARHYSRRTAL